MSESVNDWGGPAFVPVKEDGTVEQKPRVTENGALSSMASGAAYRNLGEHHKKVLRAERRAIRLCQEKKAYLYGDARWAYIARHSRMSIIRARKLLSEAQEIIRVRLNAGLDVNW